MTRALLDLKPTLRLDLKQGAYLRPLLAADVTTAYVDGLNDPEVHRYMEAPRKQRQTLEAVRAYVAANAADGQAILFGLYAGGILRGTVRLHDVDSGLGTATVGIALFDRRVWGQGLGSAAIAAVARFATGELGLTRLEAGIIAANKGSIQAFEKAGFRQVQDKRADPELGPVGLWVFEAVPAR
ncbi:MAG: GNAT family N-acetyltransferase [Dongiaceae bacterium]